MIHLMTRLITPRPSLFMTILIGLAGGFVLSQPAQSHPHVFHAATDEGVLYPYRLSGLESTDRADNTVNRYRLIFTEAVDFKNFNEFYVCLRENAPDSDQDLEHCVNAFHIEHHDETHPLNLTSRGRVLFAKGSLINHLKTRSSALLSDISDPDDLIWNLPNGQYIEQAEPYYKMIYPYESDFISDGQIHPQARFDLKEKEAPIHIHTLLTQWLIHNKSFLPVRIPILLPVLATYIKSLNLNVFIGGRTLLSGKLSFGHCVPIFQAQRWTADLITKLCRTSTDHWHGDDLLSTHIHPNPQLSKTFSLDHFTH